MVAFGPPAGFGCVEEKWWSVPVERLKVRAEGSRAWCIMFYEDGFAGFL